VQVEVLCSLGRIVARAADDARTTSWPSRPGFHRPRDSTGVFALNSVASLLGPNGLADRPSSHALRRGRLKCSFGAHGPMSRPHPAAANAPRSAALRLLAGLPSLPPTGVDPAVNFPVQPRRPLLVAPFSSSHLPFSRRDTLDNPLYPPRAPSITPTSDGLLRPCPVRLAGFGASRRHGARCPNVTAGSARPFVAGRAPLVGVWWFLWWGVGVVGWWWVDRRPPIQCAHELPAPRGQSFAMIGAG